jgi:hypothetical protein
MKYSYLPVWVWSTGMSKDDNNSFCQAKFIQNPTFQTGLEKIIENPTFQTGGVVLQDTESLEALTRKIKQNATNMTEDHDGRTSSQHLNKYIKDPATISKAHSDYRYIEKQDLAFNQHLLQ